MTRKPARVALCAALFLTAAAAHAGDKPRCTTNRVTNDTVCQLKGAEVAWLSNFTGAGDVRLYTVNGEPRLRFVWTPRSWKPQAAMVNVDGELVTVGARYVTGFHPVGLPATETYDAIVTRDLIERMANAQQIFVALTSPTEANPASTVVSPKVAQRWLRQLDTMR